MLLVLALTGSALAVTQQRLYRGPSAGGVTAVQQHSVFVEIVVEDREEREREDEIHEFGAVVGLVKKCKRVEEVFDNAVLWFNDQFLFGDKHREARNVTPNGSLGWNPEDNDLMQRNGETGRWGGCYVPDGFVHAIGSDDPVGVGAGHGEGDVCGAEAPARQCPGEDNVDVARRLIELDNRCNGCIFEYQSSFFVTDPNYPDSPREVRWIVDKFVYPVSATGNLFQESPGECASDNGTLPVSDPRDDYPHHDRCSDDEPQNNHRCSAGAGDCRRHGNASGERSEILEPLFSVHLQVDTTGMGFVDKAPWEYEDGSGPVEGMPVSQHPSEEAFEDCKTDSRESYECSIEYNFLIAVDFAAFDDAEDAPGEDEVREGSVHHGRNRGPQPPARDGNSHPHNPQTADAGPDHVHDALSLDVFFHERAPFFTMESAYWNENGSPPAFSEDCSDVAAGSNAGPARTQAVRDRTPIVCDTDRDDGSYHVHDGSQTIRPT